MGTIITLVILVALILYAISIYNNLVNSRNRVGNAFSQIDVQLTRRYDLIPNLCLLYTSPSPRDGLLSRMPSSA